MNKSLADALPAKVEQSSDASSLLKQVLADYRGLPGGYDEAVSHTGDLRAAWKPLLAQFGRLTAAEVDRRSAQAQRQIDIDGVVFNPHDDRDVSRPWRMDPIPLVLAEEEWKSVAEGLQQRAQLADLILLDLLGPQTLLHEKVVPPELLFANPHYQPAYHDLVQRPRQHLQLYAADLARWPDGSWCVTGERTRTPSGLGFVLENRLITSRLWPKAFALSNVYRLAPFFMTLQATLRDLAKRYRDNPRIAIWSRGLTSKSYFEDSFLTRYLGYTLVESDDLAVRGNRVMLKTLGGLLPVEVLLRRLEDRRCDPTELRGEPGQGVSGLLEVIRSGNVSIANSLGSSYAESPMLLAFLPAICQHVLGEDLKLKSVATWWCGHKAGLDYVLQHLDRLIIRSAYRVDDAPPVIPALLDKRAREALIERIKAEPARIVGQQRLLRSTTPVWEEGHLRPWSLTMRAFLVAKEEGYQPLPGALARVSPDPDVLSQDMTSGEMSQDVWIVAKEAVPVVSLLSVQGQQTELQRSGADLPSRVADNLFWLGRNLERAEQLTRLVRFSLMQATSEDADEGGLAHLEAACTEAGLLSEAAPPDKVSGLPFSQRLIQGALDPAAPGSLRRVVQAAQLSASKVRDRIALDSFRIITDLREQYERPVAAGEDTALELLAILDASIDSLSATSGLASENMTRTLGWRFLDLGRRLERGFQTARRLSVFLGKKPADLNVILEVCLQICDSFMTYRNRYLANLELAAVLDLLIVDDSNPRSLAFQLRQIHEHVEQLPRSSAQAAMSVEQRSALSIYNSVRLSDVFELAKTDSRDELSGLDKLLKRLTEQLPKLADAISARFLIHAGVFQRHYGRTFAQAVPRESRE